LTLMTPFFNPGPIESPEVPIFIAGVNTGLCRLAGELADGFIAHPYHSERYLEEVVRSAIAEGARRAGRQTDEVKIYVSVLTVTEPDLIDFVRSQIAFYASTPSYRPVMALHGWGEVADRLLSLSKKRAWGEMPGLISDEMVETFALVVPPDQLSDALRARYAGLADRISLYLPYIPGHQDDFWRKLVRDFREA
jgi:probable F420-dependent oxidoreductase